MFHKLVDPPVDPVAIKAAKESAFEKRKTMVTEHFTILTKTVNKLTHNLKERSDFIFQEFNELYIQMGGDPSTGAFAAAISSEYTKGFIELVEQFAVAEKEFQNTVLSKLVPSFVKLTAQLFKAPRTS